jgi:Zn-finger nucleic acid-binding protein
MSNKITLKRKDIYEAWAGGKLLGVFSVESEWEGFSSLKGVAGKLIVSRDTSALQALGSIFGQDEEVTVIRASQNLYDVISKVGESVGVELKHADNHCPDCLNTGVVEDQSHGEKFDGPCHCGGKMNAENEVAASCPHCGFHEFSKPYGMNQSIAECKRCAGTWEDKSQDLDNAMIEAMKEGLKSDPENPFMQGHLEALTSGDSVENQQGKCPSCDGKGFHYVQPSSYSEKTPCGLCHGTGLLNVTTQSPQ